MKKTIKIDGMNCGHCTAAVNKALSQMPGVSNVQVSLEDKWATVEIEDSVSEQILKEAIEDIGFDVVGFE